MTKKEVIKMLNGWINDINSGENIITEEDVKSEDDIIRMLEIIINNLKDD